MKQSLNRVAHKVFVATLFIGITVVNITVNWLIVVV